MKYLIASDIHGSAYHCRKLMERFEEEKADKLLLLGDLLYHGPRNALPEEYDPKVVIDLLNAHKDRIICVRGNCDAEVDQMVLDFPITAECFMIPVGKNIVYATHGHVHNLQNRPKLNKGDILLHGHTHVPANIETETFRYLNPGSVSLPKEDSAPGYMTLENGTFIWKGLSGKEYMRYEMFKTISLL